MLRASSAKTTPDTDVPPPRAYIDSIPLFLYYSLYGLQNIINQSHSIICPNSRVLSPIRFLRTGTPPHPARDGLYAVAAHICSVSTIHTTLPHLYAQHSMRGWIHRTKAVSATTLVSTHTSCPRYDALRVLRVLTAIPRVLGSVQLQCNVPTRSSREQQLEQRTQQESSEHPQPARAARTVPIPSSLLCVHIGNSGMPLLAMSTSDRACAQYLLPTAPPCSSNRCDMPKDVPLVCSFRALIPRPFSHYHADTFQPGELRAQTPGTQWASTH